MQCDAACCSVLQCVGSLIELSSHLAGRHIFIRDAVRCSVLQCAAVCCSVLQCDAVDLIETTFTSRILQGDLLNSQLQSF